MGVSPGPTWVGPLDIVDKNDRHHSW